MPRSAFVPENRSAATGPQFDKIKLKKGQKVRVYAGFEAPVTIYVHRLVKPKLLNGQPIISQVEGFRGEMEDRMQTEFVSNPLCLGDFDTLETDGLDPAKCPVCQYHVEHPQDGVEPPQKRYAMNVFEYRTKPNSFDPTANFGGDIKVWSITQRVFDKLFDFTQSHGPLDEHDLLLGPCENEQFQKFEFVPAPNAIAREDKANAKYMLAEFKESALSEEDLELSGGRRKELRYLNMDLASIRAVYEQIERSGGGHVDFDSGDDSTLADDLQKVFGDDEEAADEAPKASKAKTGGTAALSDLIKDDDADEEAAPEADESTEDSAGDEDDDDFAAMLSKIKG